MMSDLAGNCVIKQLLKLDVDPSLFKLGLIDKNLVAIKTDCRLTGQVMAHHDFTMVGGEPGTRAVL